MFKSNTDNKTDPRGDLYAGAKACAKCHQNIYNSYLNTAHFLASNPANEFTVDGNFSKGFNVFQVNDSQKVVMEKTDSGLFQNYYLNGKVKDRYRFDIVFGGVKGESYLLWEEHKLFQLPLSYFTNEKRWSTRFPISFRLYNFWCMPIISPFIPERLKKYWRILRLNL